MVALGFTKPRQACWCTHEFPLSEFNCLISISNSLLASGSGLGEQTPKKLGGDWGASLVFPMSALLTVNKIAFSGFDKLQYRQLEILN